MDIYFHESITRQEIRTKPMNWAVVKEYNVLYQMESSINAGGAGEQYQVCNGSFIASTTIKVLHKVSNSASNSILLLCRWKSKQMLRRGILMLCKEQEDLNWQLVCVHP